MRLDRRLRPSGFGNKLCGSRTSEAGLAEALAPGENPAMVHAFAGIGRAPDAPGFVMANHALAHVRKPAIRAMILECTSAGDPSASITAKRSGSCAAKARKASATRA